MCGISGFCSVSFVGKVKKAAMEKGVRKLLEKAQKLETLKGIRSP